MAKQIIESIREFSRFYTTILGVVNNHVLESEFSLPEARVLYELLANSFTVRELKEQLQIDEGYTSRIVSKLQKMGLLEKKQSLDDRRVYYLSLTGMGRKVAKRVDIASNQQAEKLVKHLKASDQVRLVQLLKEVKMLLSNV